MYVRLEATRFILKRDKKRQKFSKSFYNMKCGSKHPHLVHISPRSTLHERTISLFRNWPRQASHPSG